ncbi:hypothetical protein [Streptomyces sp. NPDC029526]|uniref:hypothetical protein n=1 Tax=Streptomyces sp. NPDC029526 TaxID=3155728 RepID=UPI003405130C
MRILSLSTTARRSVTAAVVGAVLAAGAVTETAVAAEAPHQEAERTATVVEAATGTEDVAPPGTPTAGINVTTPATAGGSLTASTEVGGTLSLGLPARSDVPAFEAGVGTVVYPNASPSTDLAVQATKDGGARALVVLKDAEASTTQRFTLGLPSDASLIENGSGGFDITRETAEGVHTTIGTLDAPWAKDAHGKPVPTRYNLDGDHVVQTVDVDEDTAFPVVADPKFTWGIVTGTAYFKKSETKKVAQNGALTAMAAWALPPGLNAYVTMHSAAITATAAKAHSAKKCLKIKFAAGLFVPGQYSGGYCK